MSQTKYEIKVERIPLEKTDEFFRGICSDTYPQIEANRIQELEAKAKLYEETGLGNLLD
ncbi:MAG: hypothetical protein ACE5ES_05970 [Candidatus Nanoarchaeia archaeon]